MNNHLSRLSTVVLCLGQLFIGGAHAQTKPLPTVAANEVDEGRVTIIWMASDGTTYSDSESCRK
ncbi:MAG: hypothetical protein WCG42_10110, partial [Parachlamydiaceae bacterium]